MFFASTHGPEFSPRLWNLFCSRERAILWVCYKYDQTLYVSWTIPGQKPNSRDYRGPYISWPFTLWLFSCSVISSRCHSTHPFPSGWIQLLSSLDLCSLQLYCTTIGEAVCLAILYEWCLLDLGSRQPAQVNLAAPPEMVSIHQFKHLSSLFSPPA